MNGLWVGRKDQVFQLHCVVGQCVHKVEVEVAEELRVILEDDKNDVESRRVEAAHGSRGLLAGNEVRLDESEAVNEEVLHLVEAGDLALNFELLALVVNVHALVVV